MKFIKAIIAATCLFIGSTAMANTCIDVRASMTHNAERFTETVNICKIAEREITINDVTLKKVSDYLYVSLYNQKDGTFVASLHYMVELGLWVFQSSSNTDEGKSNIVYGFIYAPKNLWEN